MAGYTLSKDQYQARLKRIEGQVRGLQRMIEDDTYCIDVLTQVAAAQKALQSLANELLDDHLRHCVREALANGEAGDVDDKVTEAMAAVRRLTRS